MPDVKIKGYSGNELHYADVPKVWLAAEESTEDNPILAPFTYGEALDAVEIIPDFSAGDMQITVPEGYLARSAVVKRPENLVPENVAEGVDIAGIIGTLATGGGSAKVAWGTFEGAGAVKTIEHGLGVAPDVICVARIGLLTNTNQYICEYCFGVSNALHDALGMSFYGKFLATCRTYAGSIQYYRASSNLNAIDDTATASRESFINNANNISFVFGGTSFASYVAKGEQYSWIAIAGLT